MTPAPLTKQRLAGWFAIPALLWFLLFILAPMMAVCAISLAKRGAYGQIQWALRVENYFELVTPLLAHVLVRTLLFAGATAVICVELGALAAWAIAASPPRLRETLVILISVPFLTNGMVRILGLRSFVSVGGPLDWALTVLHIPHDPFSFGANGYLVAVGMVAAYLPFAVLPIYGAFEKFDFSLIEAAQDLGAGNQIIFLQIVLPILWRPFVAAGFLVFIPSLGEYLIPDLLGGAKALLLGNMITEKFLRARDWPSGSALAITLVGCLILAWMWVGRSDRRKYER